MTQLFMSSIRVPDASKTMNSECSELTTTIHLCDQHQPRRLAVFSGQAMGLGLIGMWVLPSSSFFVFIHEAQGKLRLSALKAAPEDGGKVL